MNKDFILAEIKRTAGQNGGVPLGRAKFANVTGIKETDWYGRHWSRWGDALAEAGYQPNELQQPFDEGRLLEALALLARELRSFPSRGRVAYQSSARQNISKPYRIWKARHEG